MDHRWRLQRQASLLGFENELYQALLNTNPSCISKGDPTYWPSDPRKLPDCIDFFVTHAISSRYIDVTNVADLTSDHAPVVLTLTLVILCYFQHQRYT